MFCHDIVFLQKDVLGIPYVIKNTYFFLKINKNAINQYKKREFDKIKIHKQSYKV